MQDEEKSQEELESDKSDLRHAAVDFASVVDTSRKKKLVALVVGVSFALIAVAAYFYFSDGQSDAQDVSPPDRSANIPAPVVPLDLTHSSDAAIDEAKIRADQLKAEKALQPIAPQPAAPSVTPNARSQESALAQARQAKVTSGIIAISGSVAKEATTRREDTNFVTQISPASHVQVTHVGDMSRVIVQGKILESILETPINTSFPGPVRAVLSKDVYSEKGSNILIPRGSRLIGTIDGGYTAGQDRIIVKWSRIIMPSGYDVMVTDAPATDKLGQIGIAGAVSKQFLSTVGNAVLMSAINVAVAKVMQKTANIASNQQLVTENASGTLTLRDNTDPVQQAAKQGVQDIATATAQWIKDSMSPKPFVTVPQGSIVKVFVNQDVLFPREIGSKLFRGGS